VQPRDKPADRIFVRLSKAALEITDSTSYSAGVDARCSSMAFQERRENDAYALLWGVLLLLAAGVLAAQILDYVQTGLWSNISLLEFFDLLTEDGKQSTIHGGMFGLSWLLSAIPALPLFLIAALIGFLRQPRATNKPPSR
jgi:hypothetical protein